MRRFCAILILGLSAAPPALADTEFDIVCAGNCQAAFEGAVEDVAAALNYKALGPAEPGGIVIRGESGLRGDAAMARDAALRDAAAQLYDTLEGDPRRERSPIASWSRERARERLAKALANPVTSGSYVRDWYVAESGRALGTVYRAHALLSVPRDEFEAWGNRLGDWAAGTERRVWALLALCVLAIPLTFIAYLKLDATTRGCCSFGLRIGALAIVALVFLASWASVT